MHGKRNGSRARALYVRPSHFMTFLHEAIFLPSLLPMPCEESSKSFDVANWTLVLTFHANTRTNSVKQNGNENEKDEGTVQQSEKSRERQREIRRNGTEEQRQRETERRRQRTVNMSGTVFLIFIYL